MFSFFKPKKQIYIPFDYGYVGGPRSFMDRLKEYLDKYNFPYTTNIKRASGAFFANVVFDKESIQRIKKDGGKIVQRLDGVTYPKLHGQAYETLEHTPEIKDIYKNYSDFIVFQSEYSLKQCFEMYGKKNENEYAIIVNGVEKDIFFPENNPIEKIDDQKIKFVTTGNFRRLDMLAPIVTALDLIENKYDFQLDIIGDIANPALQKYLDRKYINLISKVGNKEIAKHLRESHIFLFSSINPPCPNSVIEAISCGIPVVTFLSGSMDELLGFNKDLLAFVSNDLFHAPSDLNPTKLTEKIEDCIINYEKYKKIAMGNSYRYSFDETGTKYLEVFRKIFDLSI